MNFSFHKSQIIVYNIHVQIGLIVESMKIVDTLYQKENVSIFFHYCLYMFVLSIRSEIVLSDGNLTKNVI